MKLDEFWQQCRQSKPGDIVTQGSKRWRVAWIMSEGQKLAVGLETISASAEALTPNLPAAPDGAALNQRKEA
jgi:hypothetical protein